MSEPTEGNMTTNHTPIVLIGMAVIAKDDARDVPERGVVVGRAGRNRVAVVWGASTLAEAKGCASVEYVAALRPISGKDAR